MITTPQVERTHYDFNSYAFPGRFVSYYWQLKEVLGSSPTSILEVGAGDRVFGNFLKSNTTITYTSVDVASDLMPDVVGSVLDLPFPDASFDTVCAFEVLEHLPFEQFETAVRELHRVARTRVIISLPHFGPTLALSCKIPFFPKLEVAVKIPFPKTHVFNGQHYWELGKRGFPVRRIREVFKKFFTIEREFIPFENQYHRFFVLAKHSGKTV